jgi:hypothetical protein
MPHRRRLVGGERLSRNAPFFHHKATLWEGGIRVACLVRWHRPCRPPAAGGAHRPLEVRGRRRDRAALRSRGGPAERENLAVREPERLTALRARVLAWEDDVDRSAVAFPMNAGSGGVIRQQPASGSPRP